MEEGRTVSFSELADKLFKVSGLGEEASREMLEPLLRSNALCTEDAQGHWQIPPHLPLLSTFLPDTTFAVVDIETTGGRPPQHRITEIAAVKVRAGEIGEEFHSLVHPMREIPWNVVRLTGITDEMVAAQPGIRDVLPEFLDFVEGCVFVAHGAAFDHLFIRYFARELFECDFASPVLCTFKLAQRLLPSQGRYNLGELSAALGVEEADRHRALGDARVTAEVLRRFLAMIQLGGLQEIADVLSFQEPLPPEEEPVLAKGLSLEQEDFGGLPARRGVFRLLDSEGGTVYATKAADIQRAVREIFYPKNKSAARFAERLGGVQRIEAMPYESELGMSLEAVRSMRASRMMNGHLPGGPQNFLKIELDRNYPRVMTAARFVPDGGAYYGPFRKQAQLRELFDVILRLFPLRCALERGDKAQRAEKEGKDNRVLPDVSPKHYHRVVEGLQDFLEGRMRRRGERDLAALLERAWDGKGPSSENIRRLITRLRHFVQTYALSGPSVERRNLLIVEPGETRAERICYFLREGLLVEEMRFQRDAPPEDALASRIRAVYFSEPPVECKLDKESMEEAGVIAAWLRRELMDGFVLKVSPDAEPEQLRDLILQSLKDPLAAGTVIAV